MRLSLSEALRVEMQARASGDGLLALLTLTNDQIPVPDPVDYSVSAALAAAAADNVAYFDSTLPVSVASKGPFVPPIPAPPSQRAGFTAQDALPGITSADHGVLLKNVLTSARFPQRGSGVEDVQNRAYINPAPDGSPACIEYRYTAGVSTSIVQFRMNQFAAAKHLALSCEVWWQAGFDWRAPPTATGGKIGVGLFAGPGTVMSGGASPELQEGVSIRNTWYNGTNSQPARYNAECQLYSYEFNRRQVRKPEGMFGRNTGTENWTTGRWVPLEYEVLMNDAGFANGFVRMWLDSQLVAEVADAVLTLDGTWGLRGLYASDQWNTGTPPQDQRAWVRNLRYRIPTGSTSMVLPSAGTQTTRLRYVRNGTPITSRGLTFDAYPFDVILPDQEQGVPPTAKLEINNVGRDVMGLLREARGRIYCTVEIVKISDHDYVESTWPRFVLNHPRTQGAATITADLALPDLSLQRYPKDRFVEAYYPALARAS